MLFWKKKTTAAAVPPPIPVTPPAPVEPVDDGAPRKKIMVVDDDPIILKTLSFTLQSKGFKVVTATDGSQAIGLMRDESPDMMLVDVTLPPDVGAGGVVPWDGFQVAQWIRRMNGRVPTIVISGTDRPDYQQRAKALGAEFFAKPINNDLLLASIASAIGEPQTATQTTVKA
jgi:CheY-like chemotaxis protein